MPLGSFGKIAIGWTVFTVLGVSSFVWSKRSIEQKRIESMRVRERMRKSNYGDYEASTRKFDL